MREEIFKNPRTFFVIVLYCTKRRCSEIDQQLKVKVEDVKPYSILKKEMNCKVKLARSYQILILLVDTIYLSYLQIK